MRTRDEVSVILQNRLWALVCRSLSRDGRRGVTSQSRSESGTLCKRVELSDVGFSQPPSPPPISQPPLAPSPGPSPSYSSASSRVCVPYRSLLDSRRPPHIGTASLPSTLRQLITPRKSVRPKLSGSSRIHTCNHGAFGGLPIVEALFFSPVETLTQPAGGNRWYNP